VLAVVDEESEITYFEVGRRDPTGTSSADAMLPADCEADLLADRVVIWEPPLSLYEQTFYGQPLEGREYDEPTLQCSLLEATYLAERGALALEAETVRERGREVEGERFDRRLTVYTALRERGVVPKTGYKFGADFRTYADVESVENLGHSELLVRVHPAEYVFEPRDLALDVRLAHGVRKTVGVRAGRRRRRRRDGDRVVVARAVDSLISSLTDRGDVRSTARRTEGSVLHGVATPSPTDFCSRRLRRRSHGMRDLRSRTIRMVRGTFVPR